VHEGLVLKSGAGSTALEPDTSG